ncbi:MAG TPA: XdhC family protein [Thermoanaerobaculia bacterium]|nr:XdhC family protein [Thermoanaerobaculia bacterium]
MHELCRIENLLRRDGNGVLVTLIRTEGSTYRKAGAKLFLSRSGAEVGAISGGCIETAIRTEADRLFAGGSNRLFVVDTTRDGDLVFGSGSGCPGRLHLLFERMSSESEHGVVTFAAESVRQRRRVVLATSVSAGAGKAAFTTDDSRSSFAGAELDAAVERTARSVQSTGIVTHEWNGSGVEVFYDVIEPPHLLAVCGAGGDALPLISMAAECGFDVIVIDPREALAAPARFPAAGRILLSHPDRLRDCLMLDERTAAVVMTHNYFLDLACLDWLMGTAARYIGVVGSRTRFTSLVRDVSRSAGAEAGRIFGPAGLDIGSETASEIALSILAEAKAVLTGRSGASMTACRPQPLVGATD